MVLFTTVWSPVIVIVATLLPPLPTTIRAWEGVFIGINKILERFFFPLLDSRLADCACYKHPRYALSAVDSSYHGMVRKNRFQGFHLPLDVRQGCLDASHQKVGESTREVWHTEEGGREALEDGLLTEENGF